MADKLIEAVSGAFRRFADMGDGTYAEVVSRGDSPLVRANFSRPAEATQYSAGDIIANSGTANLVVPLTFSVPKSAGRLTGCSAVVTPASSNLVIAALDFNLLLFRPETGIPFAAAGYPADNAAMAISAAAFRECVAKFSFVNGAWTNPAGGLTAGVTGYQAVVATTSRTFAPYNVSGLAQTLIGVVQAVGVWNPGAVVNRFDFTLDIA